MSEEFKQNNAQRDKESVLLAFYGEVKENVARLNAWRCRDRWMPIEQGRYVDKYKRILIVLKSINNVLEYLQSV